MVPELEDPTIEKKFFVSFPPKYTAHSPLGWATRPILAFDIEAGKVVFLKDYCRAGMDGMKKEGGIWARLESNHGNDVRDHTILTHTLGHEKWACRSRDMVLLRHFQISLDVVAWPLTSPPRGSLWVL
jgi:hypothetical protein